MKKDKWYNWNPFAKSPVKEIIQEVNDGIAEEITEIVNTELRNQPVVATQLGRSSRPPLSVNPIKGLNSSFTYIKPGFNFDAIPLIRKLRTHNPDVGLVINDNIELTNTGHKIKFSESVPEKQANLMRTHLKEVTKGWADGMSGIDGIVNKLIAQAWIGGAISGEFVPDARMTRIKSLALVNPEEIRVKLNKRTRRYEFYQQVNYNIGESEKYLKKLNSNQYKYFAINGDEEVPYGIPPFIAALEAIETQKDMKSNISFIVDQVGIMGFLEFLMTKPDQKSDESQSQYEARLIKTLTELRTNVSKGFKDGLVVGYEGDHEATFHSTSKNVNGLDSIFNLNEVQVANGLKTSPSFLGVSAGGAETSIAIIFTKLLSQLSNIQMIVSSFLEFGYKLELRLAGFPTTFVNSLSVEFKPSTISDDLKTQQSGEIKRRNLQADYNQGIISQDTFAELLGYEKADQKEPREVKTEPGADGNDPKKKEDREKDKDDSDRRVRDKKKPQSKRKDQDTKKP